MARNLGGQKRTIILPCGKTIIGNPREADNKAILHRKYCQTCPDDKYKPSPFNSYNNSIDNVTMSRQGNASKANKKIIRVINDTCKTLEVNGVTTVEQAGKAVRQAVQLSEKKDDE